MRAAGVAAADSSLATESQPARFVRAADGAPHNVLGSDLKIKLAGADTDGQLVLLEDRNPPGSALPTHTHTREDEVFRVLEGEVELTIGERTAVLGPGDIAFAPRGVPHAWRVVGDVPCRTIVTAYPAGIEHMFAELGALPAGPPDLAKLGEICGRYGITFA